MDGNNIDQVIRIPYGGAATELKLPFDRIVVFFGNDQRLSRNDHRVAALTMKQDMALAQPKSNVSKNEPIFSLL
ncbi:MAG: hypothetical protein DSM106950_25845 [Stigonema ocellatum SAG 48.90 = DSM 106950]|nr:hypothetical protein [Stigonema ocellatum SAG 48.90 = DSM 106950]